MLKILHTADIHLGAKFSGLGNKGAIQREQLRTTFKNVIAAALSEGAGIVLIAGDLFDSNEQPQRNIDLVMEQFNLLGSRKIPVCLIPGTHDSLDYSSIYRKIDFEGKCPNLKIFAEKDVSWKEYPDLDLTVYGNPNLSNRSYTSPLKGLKRSTSTRFHVAMAHGSFYIPEKTAEDDHVFRLDEIEASGMNYIALGHWHRPYRCSEKPPAWYPGPPEWIPGQTEKGAVLLVSLSDSGEVSVESRKVGLRDYDEVEVDTGEVRELAALKARVSEGANQNLVRQVTLRGLRDAELIINPEELEADPGDKFFHLSVVDRSHPKLEEISEDEERLIRNRFIKLMHKEIEALEGEEKEIAENALQYGIALLDGKEVL
jgi:DNA repair exonuclease SbcCD nuclease subunit